MPGCPHQSLHHHDLPLNGVWRDDLEVARSAPDGYTLCMTISGINGINPVLYCKMPLDPNKDLTSVAARVWLWLVQRLFDSIPAALTRWMPVVKASGAVAE